MLLLSADESVSAALEESYTCRMLLCACTDFHKSSHCYLAGSVLTARQRRYPLVKDHLNEQINCEIFRTCSPPDWNRTWSLSSSSYFWAWEFKELWVACSGFVQIAGKSSQGKVALAVYRRRRVCNLSCSICLAATVSMAFPSWICGLSLSLELRNFNIWLDYKETNN